MSGRAADLQVIDLSEFEPQERSELVSRVFNVLLAAVFLVLVSPVMLLTAVSIRLSSRGPVLYTKRVSESTGVGTVRVRCTNGAVKTSVVSRLRSTSSGPCAWTRRLTGRPCGRARMMTA